MEQLLARLSRHACSTQVVVSEEIRNGIQMLVYPLENGILIAVGYERGRISHSQIETAMRRRYAQLSRYGAWMPALFVDGSWYMVRRIEQDNHGAVASTLPEEELRAALELLA